MTRVRRTAWTTGIMLVMAAAATGCGNAATKDVAATTTAAPAVRTLVLPTADDALNARVGEEHVEALTGAGCSLGTYPEEEPTHVKAGTDLPGKTYPPTTGQHYEDWGAFGAYDQPVPDGFVVHNLEHGGVAVWHGDEVDEATVTAIHELLDDDEKWMIVPRPDDAEVPGLFAAAWAKGLYCPPEALTALGPTEVARHLDAWYEAVQSTGSEAEKDIPAYAGAMKEPTPIIDISTDTPQF